MTLPEFILARIAEDEDAATPIPIGVHFSWERMRAECVAKRRVVEHLDNLRPDEEEWELILSFLALPYADHESYDERWRP